MDTSKSEMKQPIGIPSTYRVSEKNGGNVTNDPNEIVTESARLKVDQHFFLFICYLFTFCQNVTVIVFSFLIEAPL